MVIEIVIVIIIVIVIVVVIVIVIVMAVLHMNDGRPSCHTKHCVIPSLAVFHSQVEGAS